ncbi:MAG: type II toxin-antitoxin system VapC family toxin [Achromobacter sp.]|uniref:type II toxin-antitoxin system VapC family toxin n=1 Tax=Achromobacter sp. TaxID=134375 RepID=UPI003D05B476
MKLVLDASVALSWLRLPSQTCSEQAFGILDDLNGEAVLVPQIWPTEVAQGTLRVERLAREHGLTVYDASYLELALWRGAALATFDKRPAQAAQASGLWVVGHEPVNRLEEPVMRYGGRHCLAGLALTSPRTSSGTPAPHRGARQTRRRPAAAP